MGDREDCQAFSLYSAESVLVVALVAISSGAQRESGA
jgi:hypothetical protein